MMEMEEALRRVENRVRYRHHVGVSRGDVPEPNTGDFDGKHITLSPKLDPETSLFVLAHLFGHTVQWDTEPALRELGMATASRASEGQMAAIEAYERDASRYGLGLMHEADVTHLDRWLTSWWDADWRWLANLYRTGERIPDFKTLLRDLPVSLEPRPIPAFTPRQWATRWSF